jgi:hypothetical protein
MLNADLIKTLLVHILQKINLVEFFFKDMLPWMISGYCSHLTSLHNHVFLPPIEIKNSSLYVPIVNLMMHVHMPITSLLKTTIYMSTKDIPIPLPI